MHVKLLVPDNIVYEKVACVRKTPDNYGQVCHMQTSYHGQIIILHILLTKSMHGENFNLSQLYVDHYVVSCNHIIYWTSIKFVSLTVVKYF